MLLCADIGNSSVKFTVFDGEDRLCKPFSFSSSVSRSADEFAFLIINLLQSRGVQSMPDSCVICSVVPDLTVAVQEAAVKICGREPFVIGTGTHTGFQIRTESHAELGADIVANTAAALSVCHGPLAIVDVGTATTVTAVSRCDELLGTIIAPGIRISLDALHSSAALLTEVSLNRPDELIGRNSVTSISSGVINGAIIMIDGFVRQLREQLCENGEKLSLIATGGLANVVLPYCRNKFTQISDLTLLGAARLFYNNVK